MFFLGFFWFPWRECLDTCFFSNIIFFVYFLFFSCFRGFGCFLLFDFLFDLQLHWVLLFERLSALSSYALMCGALAICSAVVRSTLFCGGPLNAAVVRSTIYSLNVAVVRTMFHSQCRIWLSSRERSWRTQVGSLLTMAAKMLQLTFSRGLALSRNSVKTHVLSDTLQETQPKKQMRTEVNRCKQM